MHVNGNGVPLTGAEFRVLELLMRSAGQVISRETLTEQALGRKLVAYDSSIDTHISNLRRKLDLPAGRIPKSKTCAAPATRSGRKLARRMHSLYLRIFLLFWVAMALIVGGSIAITFTIAAREYEAPELQRRPSVAIQASEVLARGGVAALKNWLGANKNSIPDRDLYIIGPDGADILGRRLSESAARRLEFFNRDEIVNRGGNFRRRAPRRRSLASTDRSTPCCWCRGVRASSAR